MWRADWGTNPPKIQAEFIAYLRVVFSHKCKALKNDVFFSNMKTFLKHFHPFTISPSTAWNFPFHPHNIVKISTIYFLLLSRFFLFVSSLKAPLSPTYEAKPRESVNILFTCTTHLPWSHLKYRMRHNLIRDEDEAWRREWKGGWYFKKQEIASTWGKHFHVQFMRLFRVFLLFATEKPHQFSVIYENKPNFCACELWVDKRSVCDFNA